MKDGFFKFPSTPHLTTSPGIELRGDKVLKANDLNKFVVHDLTIEEKVDGANLGISFDLGGNVRCQNRGSVLHLPESGQWKKLEHWIGLRSNMLFDHLSDRYILFGEWCYAKHSIYYDNLPDWFLAFDIYDQVASAFLSTPRRDDFLDKMALFRVPHLGFGRFSIADLGKLMAQSKLSSVPAEGLYLRYDVGGWLGGRAKLVRPEFVQSVEEHWSQSAITPNRLRI